MDFVSKLNEDSSVKIPEYILKKSGLKPGSEIIWLFDDHTGQISIMEKPQSFARVMKGLGKESWKNVDVDVYIKEERESW